MSSLFTPIAPLFSLCQTDLVGFLAQKHKNSPFMQLFYRSHHFVPLVLQNSILIKNLSRPTNRTRFSYLHRYTNDLLVIMYIYHSPATGTARTRGKSIPRDQLRTSGRLTAGSSNLLGLATVAVFDFSLSICLMHSSRFFSRR